MSKTFKPLIFADTRESLDVKKSLVELGCEVVEKTLSPADFVVSQDYAVERKELRDFFRSIFDGRLFEQVERLVEAYENPFLFVEGDLVRALKSIRNPMVFWGAITKIMADHHISLIFTPNE